MTGECIGTDIDLEEGVRPGVRLGVMDVEPTDTGLPARVDTSVGWVRKRRSLDSNFCSRARRRSAGGCASAGLNDFLHRLFAPSGVMGECERVGKPVDEDMKRLVWR